MARAYTVATSALALGVPPKWLDNTLSQHHVDGVSQRSQGVARRLSVSALVILRVSLLLIHELGMPLAKALSLAVSIITGKGTAETDEWLVLRVDVPSVASQLEARLESAVESAPVPRRGRPPKSKTGRLV